MENKCRDCQFGGIMIGLKNSLYIFKEAIKLNKTINYKLGEHGCRMDQWNNKENKCLTNNYSEFKKLNY
jgi:hypothetical protein